MAPRTRYERKDLVVKVKDKLAKKKASVVVNKDLVNRLVKYHYGTIENYLKKFSISRMRYWQVLNMVHISKDVKCLQDLASNLQVEVEQIIL